jgi:predicted transcriptional regulator
VLPKAEYWATADELRGIDRGLNDARQNKFVTNEKVEAVFEKYRLRDITHPTPMK